MHGQELVLEHLQTPLSSPCDLRTRASPNLTGAGHRFAWVTSPLRCSAANKAAGHRLSLGKEAVMGGTCCRTVQQWVALSNRGSPPWFRSYGASNKRRAPTVVR